MTDEKIIIGEATNFPLNGRLTLPKRMDGLVPAVVLVHGSGPTNMDEQIGNIAPFKDLAEGLSQKGIAVLRYDKRTFVYGKEMRNDRSLSVKEETIEDAILAANFLRNDSRIDSNKLFIIGHSLGGMLAPRIDAEGGHFTGIIIMAGSPRKFEEIIMDQNEAVLKSLNTFLKWIGRKQVAALSSKLANIYQLSNEEAKSTRVLGKYVKAFYLKEMGEHPSTDYLEVLTKPLLILQGEKDFQVSVEKDFNGYRKLLEDKSNVTFKLYPNLNHAFMPSVYGEVRKAKKEYKVAQHMDHQVIADIANWIFSV
ncbi:alpha/beta fold hydrolase [Pullulanibacillus sp. KACC 23026]|uniref:alpha/beta hydrolase family protein n=1 Tax=Pullulanibacillus sp. KACC 23026 TaxID=3028315 RepID=UPI0023B1116D|nr:alpha/beta fold hydrolase [Pullulanibacillus sp. KACC 23026]WEG14832.1 alpha/beta fold hydrolase [Pullulanibacillus sp. KACC 23026]